MKTYERECNDEWIEMLNIGKILDKYPKQLSGGERTRVSIFLATIKDPDIFILDEPTASLDRENKQIVIEFIKNYAHQGHTVIVATHDNYLIEEADVLYKIENKKLIIEKRNSWIVERENRQYKMKINHFLKYILKSKKHQKLYQKIMPVFVSISIGFLIVAFSLNNFLITQAKSQLKELFSDEIVVYKNPFPDNAYYYNGCNLVMTEEDYDVLNQIDGIERIEWRYDNYIGAQHDFYLFENSSISPVQMTSYVSNKENTTIIPENHEAYVYTYIDDRDYTNKIKYEYLDEGVYITSSLYDKLFENSSSTDLQIEFALPVPIYNSTGISSIVSNIDESVEFPGNYITCRYVKVKEKVRGVIDGEVLGAENYLKSGIYISQSQLLEYVNDNQNDFPDSREACWIQEINEDYDYIPEGYTASTVDQYVEQTKWSPKSCDAYTVIIDDLANFDTIVQEIKDSGYNVQNDYIDALSYATLEENTKEMYMTMGVIIIIIVSLFYIYQKYIQQVEYENCEMFLETLGYNQKVRKEYLYFVWAIDTVLCILLSTVFFELIKID